jgi:hypothetical protein
MAAAVAIVRGLPLAAEEFFFAGFLFVLTTDSKSFDLPNNTVVTGETGGSYPDKSARR